MSNYILFCDINHNSPWETWWFLFSSKLINSSLIIKGSALLLLQALKMVILVFSLIKRHFYTWISNKKNWWYENFLKIVPLFVLWKRLFSWGIDFSTEASSRSLSCFFLMLIFKAALLVDLIIDLVFLFDLWVFTVSILSFHTKSSSELLVRKILFIVFVVIYPSDFRLHKLFCILIRSLVRMIIFNLMGWLVTKIDEVINKAKKSIVLVKTRHYCEVGLILSNDLLNQSWAFKYVFLKISSSSG